MNKEVVNINSNLNLEINNVVCENRKIVFPIMIILIVRIQKCV